MSEGFIPLILEHPDGRMEVKNAIKEAGRIPVYERYREALLMHYKILIAIASGLSVVADKRKAQLAIRRILGGAETLKVLLTKPLNQISRKDIRDALIEAGALVVKEGLTKLPELLKLVVPALP